MVCLLRQHAIQVGETAAGLLDGSALDRQHAVEAALAQDLDDSRPVDNTVAAGASDRRARDLAAFGVRVLNRDVLRVDVDQEIEYVPQSVVRILAGQVCVARMRINPAVAFEMLW